MAATVLLGAGEVLLPHSSVETADAGTGPINAYRAEVAVTSVAPLRSSVPASRSAVRSVLSAPSAAEIQQIASLQIETALKSTIYATGDVEETITEEVETAAAEAAENDRRAFRSPIRNARLTSGYGQRWGRMHHGMDFGAEVGHPLYAVAQATVTTAAYNSGLGYHVRITLTDGTEVSYGHLSEISVETGDVIGPGTLVGEVGNSGSSTGAHLHFEVRGPDGERLDPRPWLAKRELL
ncbi:MAG: M23 family metallopeptidase [Ornithinimicrobium sp.]